MKNTLVIFNPSIEDGGVEKNLFLITNFLKKKIPKINIITANKSRINEFNKDINIITPKFNVNRNTNRKIKYLVCLIILIREILKNKKITVFTFQANIYAIIICNIFNVKIISRSNSAPQGWSNNLIKQFIFNFFFKRAQEIIVNSKDFKKQMDRKYSINSKCIYNPFDFQNIKKKSKEKINKEFIKKNTIKLITVGRFTDQKDQITILKSMKIILKKKDVFLFILGKGIFKDKIKNFINKNHLNKNVKILTFQKNPYKFINNADIFILSSKFEGLPNVLIEAQFLKKYIISTDCPTGPREILNNGNYGDLIKIGDYKKIAKLVLSYNKQKNIKKIKLGYKNLKRFSYKKNCNEYYKIINQYL